MAMSNAQKGAWLGLANVAVVALGFATREARYLREGIGIVLWMTVLGLPPGLLTGIVLGKLAARIPERYRLVAFVTLAFAVVAALGMLTNLGRYIPLAWIPTAAAAALLARWT